MLCWGSGEPNTNGSDLGMPSFERVEAFCRFGAGEKISTGPAEGFSVDLGVAPVLNRALVVAFAGEGSRLDGTSSPPGISTSMSISELSYRSDCCLFKSPNPSKVGMEGYKDSRATPPGEKGHTGTEEVPAPPGVAGTRSNEVANGLSLGGDSKSSGFVVGFEMRRIVVVVGSWERLSRAPEGAGKPWRFDCPGTGSTGGSSEPPFGSEVRRVEDDGTTSLLERLEDDDVASLDLDVLRLSPKEVAIALRDDVTEANRTDEKGLSPSRPVLCAGLTFGRIRTKLAHLTVRGTPVTPQRFFVHFCNGVHNHFPLLAGTSYVINRRVDRCRLIGRLVIAVWSGLRVRIITPRSDAQRVIEW